MLREIAKWVEDRLTIPGVPLWVSVTGLSVFMAVASIMVTAVALVAIPADYFLGSEAPDWTRHRHPVLRWAFRLIRNVVGWILVIFGIILSLPGVPGQGLLTVLLGLMLVEFPGKRRCEQWFVSRPRIHKAVNAIRTKFGADLLLLEGDELGPKN